MLENNYPSDWSRLKMKELTQKFLNGGTPSTHVKEYWDGNIPWITGADAEQRLTITSRKSITKLGVRHSSTNIVPKGNILLVTRTGVGKVSMSGVDVAISQDLTGLIPRSDLADVPYLYYQLTRIMSDLKSLSQGSIIQGIKREQVEAIEIPLPELAEQRVIAEILSTLDESIAKSESLVGKYHSLKQGLMSDLLTRGVDENGGLRTEYPNRSQNSPFGTIPVEWEVVLMDKVATRGSGHTPSKSHPEYWNGGIKWVSLADSNKLDKVFISDTDKNISELGIQNSSAVKHPAGTVIISRDAGIGKSAIITEEMAVSQHFIAWTCGKRLNNLFLYYWLQQRKRDFESIAFGSTIQTIGLQYFRDLKVVLPPLEEQKRIADILFTAEKMIDDEAVLLRKLNYLKQGLMQDLLSGQVRVKV